MGRLLTTATDNGILWCHRNQTGICIYRVHFVFSGAGFQSTQVEINRDPEQYSETNDDNDRQLLHIIINLILLGENPQCRLKPLNCGSRSAMISSE